MDCQKLQELVRYDPDTGKLYNKGTGRLMTISEDTYTVTVYNNTTGKRFRVKPDKLIWMIVYGKAPDSDKRILHRNLNIYDNRMVNLTIVSRRVYNQIAEAHRNLTSLKLLPHPYDQYSYQLVYKVKGVEHSETIEDVVVAKNRLLKLQLENAKLLSKYCIFD